MGNGRRIIWSLVAVLSLPARAIAQPDSPPEQTFRRWDGAGGVGGNFGVADPALARGEFIGELGRYWSAHVKTSVAVANAGHQVLAWANLPTAGYRTTITSARRPLVLSVAASYQFRENVFAHPYVSAGVRLAWLWDQSETYRYSPPNTYVLISSETSPTRLDARPVIGGGLKAYFANGRAFVRPEAIVAFNTHGSTRVLTRVLVGADF